MRKHVTKEEIRKNNHSDQTSPLLRAHFLSVSQQNRRSARRPPRVTLLIDQDVASNYVRHTREGMTNEKKPVGKLNYI